MLAPKLASTGAGSLTVLTVASALLSVVAVTAGALVQKRLSAADTSRSRKRAESGGAAVAVVVTALVSTYQWDNTPMLYVGLVWAVIVPSVIGVSLLMWMLRHGEATKVTALILAGAAVSRDPGVFLLSRNADAAPVHRIRDGTRRRAARPLAHGRLIEAQALGGDHDLRAIVGAEFLHDGAHVRLHGCLGYAELHADLLVGKSRAQHVKHAKLLRREPRHDAFGVTLRRHPDFARPHGAHRLHHGGGGGRLRHEAGRPVRNDPCGDLGPLPGLDTTTTGTPG